MTTEPEATGFLAAFSPSSTSSSSHDLSVFPERLRGKRILLCTESFGPVNGVSRTTLMLVNHLCAHGVNVAVVAPHNHTCVNPFVPAATSPALTACDRAGEPAAQERQLAVPWNQEIRLHGYPLPFNPELSVVYPVRLSALYARAFGGAPPDLIYLASPASLGYQVLLQVRQSPQRHPPVLANFQTDLAGYCAILLPRPLAAVAVYAFAHVEGFLFRHPSVRTVFYPSRAVRRYLATTARVAPAKLQLLRRGVRTDQFDPAHASAALRRHLAPHGELILLCVARLAGEKGFDFLAAAAAELARRGLVFTLHIVGGNRNAAVADAIHQLFAPLVDKGGSRVVFSGFLTGHALAEAYATADMFLHCSVTETFGLVVLEAMASGVPVVVRNAGGPSDVVCHGNSGFLVPPDDVAGFTDHVLLLACHVPLRRQMAAHARRQACATSWDTVNNTVAWRMLDVLDGCGDGTATAAAAATAATAVRRRKSHNVPVDARQMAGMGIILGFWGLVGVYLLLIKAALWTRSRARVGVRKRLERSRTADREDVGAKS